MRPDPALTLPEATNSPHAARIDLSHGPAHGLVFALPWAIVFWLAIAVMVLA